MKHWNYLGLKSVHLYIENLMLKHFLLTECKKGKKMLKPPLQKDRMNLASLLMWKYICRCLQCHFEQTKRQGSWVTLVVQVSLCLTDGAGLMKTYYFFAAAEILHLVIRQTRSPYTSYHPGCNSQTIYDHCCFWKSHGTILAVMAHSNIFILPL